MAIKLTLNNGILITSSLDLMVKIINNKHLIKIILNKLIRFLKNQKLKMIFNNWKILKNLNNNNLNNNYLKLKI